MTPKPRPPHVEKAERDRLIAKKLLEGGRVAAVADEFGVSRRTVQRAARAFASTPAVDQESEVRSVSYEDVIALISLAVQAQVTALRRALRVLNESKSESAAMQAANACARLLSSVSDSMLKLGYAVPPEHHALLGDLRTLGEGMSRTVLEFRETVEQLAEGLPEETQAALVVEAKRVDDEFVRLMGLEPEPEFRPPPALEVVEGDAA
jgi:transposase-like protein